MYTVILFAIVGALLIATLEYKSRKSQQLGKLSTGKYLLFLAVGGVFGSVFGFFIAGLLGCFATVSKYEQTGEWPLYSLNDSSNTGGTFFLGSGTYGDRITYTYYSAVGKKEENKLRGYTINNYQHPITIKISDGQPVLKIFSPKTSSFFYNWTVFPISDIKDYYEFNVPKDSVKTTIQIGQ